MVNILNLERDKDCKAFGCKCSECVNLACTKRHCSIQSVRLLIFQNGKLTQVLSCYRKQSFGVIIKLLLAVRSMNQREYSEHHSLITSGEVIKELFHFLFLLFHIIRNGSGKVVVLILLSLPVGDIGFHTEKSAFRFSYRFICRHRHNINGHHKVTVQVGKVCYHSVLNIRSVLTKKKNSSVTVAHLEIVLFKLHCVGANIVLKIVSFLSGFLNIKVICGFFSHTEEVVNDTKSFICFKFYAFASEP